MVITSYTGTVVVGNTGPWVRIPLTPPNRKYVDLGGLNLHTFLIEKERKNGSRIRRNSRTFIRMVSYQ